MLYPKSNSRRSVYNLNGIWQFKTVSDGFVPETESFGCRPMPVPASYNEITTDKQLANYCGKVLYERTFSIPVCANSVYRLRIGAASHKCEVYLNGEKIGEGINGFLPVDLPLTALRDENRLSVVIDNRLTFQTLPVGEIKDGKQIIYHDFYNFTGIHRDVLVYSTPEKHIEDIAIKTVVDGDYGKITVDTRTDCKHVRYTVTDGERNVVAKSESAEIHIENPQLWEPENPYLYTLRVETETDLYEETFGIRKVTFDENAVYLNGKPVYFKGFGMHEDFFILGKGNNTALNIKDFELLKWINANSIRTSHYPYSEEIMDLADRYGIMVIDEVPAVGMGWWEGAHFCPDKINDSTKELHKRLIGMLASRDKNHPSVVMLSVANEPFTNEEGARPYFKDVIEYAHTVTDLPVTLVEVMKFRENSRVGDLPDITCLNRYWGWYYHHGDMSTCYENLRAEMIQWHEKYNKPVMITEFGCDTVEGLHSLPSVTFSEEYQVECLQENCRTFDSLPFCAGEQVWNFADFRTKEGLTRIRGNRKGVFTKDRQPKMAAHYLRERWSDKTIK